MLKSYLKIAFRGLFKNKVYAFINISGLALGLAVSVLILMFVVHEFSYDKFHKNGDRIFRILSKSEMDGQTMQSLYLTQKLAPSLQEAAPEVKDFTRVKTVFQKVILKNPENQSAVFYEQDFMFADPSFFSMFSFPLREGNAASVLSRPFTLVISESAAAKYFGTEDPVGKTLLFEGKHLMEITGVAENAPSNSTLHFDFITSLATFPKLSEDNKMQWEHAGAFVTYLLLDSPKSARRVEEKIKLAGGKTGDFNVQGTYALESLPSLHLQSDYTDTAHTRLIYIFTGIALLILMLAFFNYMSLTTARATLRGREVGIRKVSGVTRFGLVKQFYVESFLICSIAFAAAFGLIGIMRVPFYNLLSLNIDASFLLSPSFIGILLGLLVLTAIVAGSYPAFILSGFAPMEVLKGRFSGLLKGAGLRRGFMVFQFTVSIALIICSLVIKDQLSFMQNKKLGFDKEQVLSIPLSETVSGHYFALRNEISQQAGVKSVTASSSGLFKGYDMFFLENFTNKAMTGITTLNVDENFVSTFGLAWKTKPANVSWKRGNYMLLNEAAIKELGIQGNPIGQKVVLQKEVAGILQNFNFKSVQEEIKAMGLFVISDTTNLLSHPGASGVLYARLDPKSGLKDQVSAIEAIYSKYETEKPFEYYFLNEAFNDTFRTEIRMAKMFSVFTGFAIFIACMGLFGLVTFTAETRVKEIGIRKVLGATITNIVAMLSKDFIKLVLMANGLAFPIAWYFASEWLQDFTYKIDVSIWTFLISGGLAIVIALLTVGFQAMRAALMNPVSSLKSE